MRQVDLDHKDIIELDRAGKLPPALRKKWAARFGKDPVDIAERIVRLEKLSSRICAVSLVFGLIGFVTALIGGFYINNAPVLFIGIAVTVAAIVAAGIAQFVVDSDFSNETRFPMSLSRLCNERGLSLELLFRLSEESLSAEAEQHLVLAAYEILVWEREHVPDELNPTISKGVLVDSFKRRHEYLHLLGLADAKYDRYFRLANELLKDIV